MFNLICCRVLSAGGKYKYTFTPLLINKTKINEVRMIIVWNVLHLVIHKTFAKTWSPGQSWNSSHSLTFWSLSGNPGPHIKRWRSRWKHHCTQLDRSTTSSQNQSMSACDGETMEWTWAVGRLLSTPKTIENLWDVSMYTVMKPGNRERIKPGNGEQIHTCVAGNTDS